MNQKSKQGPFHKRAIIFLAGLLITAMLISVYGIGLWLFISFISSLPSKWAGFTGWLAENLGESVEFLRGQEIETIVLWFIGFLISMYLIMSPLICLYWFFKPAERFWWKHKYISHKIFFGSFFGCLGIITAGVYFFLWFFPSGWTGFQARLYLSIAIGFITSFALWHKLSDFFEQKRQKNREERIEWEYQKQKRSFLEGEKTLAPFIEEIKKLEKEDKLSPFLEERLIALERVCDVLNVRWREEGAPRVANIHKDYDAPNAYGYDGIDGPIEEVDCIIEEVFSAFVKSQQKGNVQMSRTQKEAIKAFLKSLTRTERVIVVLYYYEEMTILEIAKSVDLSPSEVLQMHSSIISRCKSYLHSQELL